MHTIEVVEIHLLLEHCVAPIEIDGDGSISPMFMPDNVRIEPPRAGPLAAPTNDTTGAATQHRPI